MPFKNLKRHVFLNIVPYFCTQIIVSMFSFLNIFRITALLEGVSYILLLFIATPVKYILNEPQYVKLLGMPHGILFIGYITMAFMLKKEHHWNAKQFGEILLASMVPFGTFYIDKKYLKPLRNG